MTAVLNPSPPAVPFETVPFEIVPFDLSRVRPAARRPVAAPVVYRRRRAAAVAVVAVALLLICGLLAGAVGDRVASDTVGAGLPAVAVSPIEPAAGSLTHVVEPGDTVWSIARTLQPDGDVRSLVDDIVAANGGATLTAGQRLVLDG